MRIRTVKDLIHIQGQLRTDERRGDEQDFRALRAGSGVVGIFLRAVSNVVRAQHQNDQLQRLVRFQARIQIGHAVDERIDAGIVYRRPSAAALLGHIISGAQNPPEQAGVARLLVKARACFRIKASCVGIAVA